MGVRPVHLAERGGRRRLVLEAREFLLPAHAELGGHAALDEGPAHRRRLALQLGKLGGIFGRQHVRDGGHELCHLHDRALEAAECGGKLHGVAAAVERESKESGAGEARRNTANVGADASVACGAGGEAVLFVVGHQAGMSAVDITTYTTWTWSRWVTWKPGRKARQDPGRRSYGNGENAMPPFIRTLLQAIIGLVVVAVIWVIAAAVVDSAVRLPGLGAVIAKAVELAGSEDYARHVSESGTALLEGLVPALVIGIPLGLLAGLFAAARWVIGPLAVALAAMPLVLLVPVFVLWWGLIVETKAAAVFVISLFPIMNTVMIGVAAKRGRRNIPLDDEGKPVLTSGGGTARAIVSGLRIGVLFGVTALIVSEFMASTRGVGFFIMNSASLFDTTAMMAGVILVALPTLVVVTLLQAIEEQLAP
jgi:ABC-type nitrate/sulfonate/bicarbonate transport system permease component